MSGRQVFCAWGVLLLAAGGWFLSNSIGQEPKKKPADKPVVAETLLPENAVLFVRFDGNGQHKAAWEKTAAYEALYGSGLMPTIENILEKLAEKNKGDEEQQKSATLMKTILERVGEKGGLFSISLPTDGPPLPHATLVARDAGDLEPAISESLSKLAEMNDATFEPRELEGRTIQVFVVPDSPGVEIAWWKEGAHLVIAAGIHAAEAHAAVAAGKSPNVTTNATYKKHVVRKADYDRTTISWLDLGLLRKTFGEQEIPAGPNPVAVNDVLKALGLDTVGAIVSEQGYKGKAVWSEAFIEAPAPRKGLLSIADQKPISMKDLPPLPAGMTGFSAGSCDFAQLYETLLATAVDVSQLGPEEAAAQVEGTIKQIPAIVGFDPKADLLDALGNVYCLYGDSHGGLLGIDFAAAVQVRDAEKLRATLDDLLSMAAEQANPRELTIRRTKKQGREIITLEMAQGIVNPSFAVDDKWLCIGLFPQTVESFLLRLDGKLSVWDPAGSYADALKAVPQQFTSIAASDPRAVYRSLMGLSPLLMPIAQQVAKQVGITGPDGTTLPFSLADLPPGELVARPLFPNVAVCTVDEAGIRWTSRSSLPSFPLFGGGDSVAAVGVASVAVAVMLPAVQAAREAARRTQSANNLKMMGLAMHNYHDSFGAFPRGTIENKEQDLKVEERPSWMVAILPYADQAPLYNRLDLKQKWNSEENRDLVALKIPTYQNPGVSEKAQPEHASTHYVGIAGLGKDGPTLPANDKKAGIFAYNRQTKIQQITDGTSNTIMVAESSKDYGPWAQGGTSTIRSLTKKPYINGPDGIGGPFRGGCNVLFADGSVRFISENIDPETMEALATMAGGETVNSDF